MRTHALEVEVEEEEEEEMDNQGMNGHDSSSEKHDTHDNHEGEGKIDSNCGVSLLLIIFTSECTHVMQ
jgi:hypothetical protein